MKCIQPSNSWVKMCIEKIWFLICINSFFSDLSLISVMCSDLVARCTFCGRCWTLLIYCWWCCWELVNNINKSVEVHYRDNESKFLSVETGLELRPSSAADVFLYAHRCLVGIICTLRVCRWCIRSIQPRKYLWTMLLVRVSLKRATLFANHHQQHAKIGCSQGFWKHRLFSGIFQKGDSFFWRFLWASSHSKE